MADFSVTDCGSICILHTLTEAAQQWAADHLPEDALRWGVDGIAVEPRYLSDIVDGAIDDGLEVEL